MRRKPGSIRPHLVVKLRQGWTLEPGRRRFKKAGHEPVYPGADLPKYTRITFQVPEMARKRSRTEAEDELARLIQIVPPRRVPPAQVLERVQAWPFVEKAWVAPDVSPAAIASPP